MIQVFFVLIFAQTKEDGSVSTESITEYPVNTELFDEFDIIDENEMDIEKPKNDVINIKKPNRKLHAGHREIKFQAKRKDVEMDDDFVPEVIEKPQFKKSEGVIDAKYSIITPPNPAIIPASGYSSIQFYISPPSPGFCYIRFGTDIVRGFCDETGLVRCKAPPHLPGVVIISFSFDKKQWHGAQEIKYASQNAQTNIFYIAAAIIAVISFLLILIWILNKKDGRKIHTTSSNLESIGWKSTPIQIVKKGNFKRSIGKLI